MASQIGLPKGMSPDDAYVQGVADGESKKVVIQAIPREIALLNGVRLPVDVGTFTGRPDLLTFDSDGTLVRVFVHAIAYMRYW